MDHSADIADHSRVMLAYLRSHFVSPCCDSSVDEPFNPKGDCALVRLLQCGATTDVPGFKFTPLQIAVNLRDFYAVKTLLEAGADPNGVGKSGGMEWEETSWLSDFSHLHGARPLHIIKWVPVSCPETVKRRWEPEDSGPLTIKEILVRYGAACLCHQCED
jgi:hypothetical protein